MKVLQLREIAPATLALFAEEFPEMEWIDGSDEAMRAERLGEIEIIYGAPPAAWLDGASKLRWVQVPYAGVAPELCHKASERGIVVTNSSGIYNQTIAEHSLCLMLALARRLDETFYNQLAKSWVTPIRPVIGDLAGSPAAIVGLGGIGQAIARLCRALGMQVVGCRKTLRPTPFVDRLYEWTDLVSMARQSQWLISAVPLTTQTERIITAEVLAALPRGARFVNVSRGAIVDEQALIAALESGHLAGAGLDVTTVEPLPPDSPLWTMPRVILTPHVAGFSANASSAAAELFLRNLHHDRAGEPLEGLLDLETGY